MFVFIKNNQVSEFPYSIQQFRIDNPNISIPVEPTDEQLTGLGLYEVVLVSEPQVNFDKVTDGSQVALINGVWTQQWNIRDATDIEILVKKTEFQNYVINATQARLDAFANSRNYDGIMSACTYATSSFQKFADEGKASVIARDSTWVKLYELFAEVQSGVRPMPLSYSEIEILLPTLSWVV